MHDGGNRVPFIAQWPSKIPKGKVSQEIVDFSDFLPTFCEASEVPAPAGIDGKSFLKTLMGSDDKHRDWIYLWYTRSGKPGTAKQFTRNQRYKLYGDGPFFDVAEDVLEKTPLVIDQLTEAQQSTHEMLQTALGQYRDVRKE